MIMIRSRSAVYTLEVRRKFRKRPEYVDKLIVIISLAHFTESYLV